MHSATPRLAIATALVLSLAACGDDPAGPASDLTAEEAEVMLEALVEAGGLDAGLFGSGSFSPEADLAPQFTQEFEETVDCPEGGSIDLVGAITWDETGEAFDSSFTRTHDSCGSSASSDGSSWTFDGAPNITTSWSVQVTEDQFVMEGTESGGVSWSSGDRTGTCQIGLSYDFSGSEQSFSGSVSGSVCGHEVSQTVSWSL